MRWGLLLVAISLVYAMAALAVVAATNRAGLGIIAFFLLVGVLPDALLQLASGWLSAFQGPIAAVVSALPSAQLGQLSAELYACGNRCVDAAAVACRRCGGVWFGHAT